MKYTMKLIFSKKADMKLIEERIKDICQKFGCMVMEINDYIITYGAETYEKFGPAFGCQRISQ